MAANITTLAQLEEVVLDYDLLQAGLTPGEIAKLKIEALRAKLYNTSEKALDAICLAEHTQTLQDLFA